MVVADGGRFPDRATPMSRPHNLTFNPENGVHSLAVSSPLPGDWYLLAFVNKRNAVAPGASVLQQQQQGGGGSLLQQAQVHDFGREVSQLCSFVLIWEDVSHMAFT